MPFNRFALATLTSLVAYLMAGCQSTPDHVAIEDADSNLGYVKSAPNRSVAAKSDEREGYVHGGSHNFHPGTSHGPIAIDTNDKTKFQTDLSTFKDPKAASENYEYQTNREDILARHTFVLAGADRSLGHHVAFFESRHQHHAIVKLEFDFVGADVKKGVIKPADLKAGQTLFETKILKEGQQGVATLPKGQAYTVQVSPLNPEFELVTIPTGITRTFLGSLATIDEKGKVTRFNAKGSDVVVKVKNVFHFSRMYLKEFPRDLQYMTFSANAPENKARYVLAHVIQGTLPKAAKDDALNVEQMVEADLVEPTSAVIKDGSVLKLENRAVDALLKTDETVEAKILRDGTAEGGDVAAAPVVKLKIKKVLFSRVMGIDPSQDAIRKKLRGE